MLGHLIIGRAALKAARVDLDKAATHNCQMRNWLRLLRNGYEWIGLRREKSVTVSVASKPSPAADAITAQAICIEAVRAERARHRQPTRAPAPAPHPAHEFDNVKDLIRLRSSMR